jgi:hypothetical protein
LEAVGIYSDEEIGKDELNKEDFVTLMFYYLLFF